MRSRPRTRIPGRDEDAGQGEKEREPRDRAAEAPHSGSEMGKADNDWARVEGRVAGIGPVRGHRNGLSTPSGALPDQSPSRDRRN